MNLKKGHAHPTSKIHQDSRCKRQINTATYRNASSII
jgi:hypothetical protein